MKHRLAALAITLALSGCASVDGLSSDKRQTIGSLSPVPLPPVHSTDPGKSRATAMGHYQAFLNESPDSPFVPEAMRRLADLNLESEQAALVDGAPPDGQSRAAQLYAELLARFPDYPHNDAALYQLARAREQSGETEPAMAALDNYATRYRDGDNYDETQFRRGEYLFVHREYAQAEQAYQAVLDRGPESVFYQQALYKTGWSRFKQNAYRSALDAYMQLLDQTIGEVDTAELPETLSRADRERIDDTLRAISLSFAYLGDSTEIRDYFAQQGARRYEPLIYARLAALYLGKERFTDAAETYGLFASVHPQHREAPLFQSRVIDVYKQAGFSERVLEEKQAFIKHYEPAAAYWRQHDSAAAPEVLVQVQRHLHDVAQHYHALAQAQKQPAAYTEAAHWYQLYLRAFAQSEQAPYMNFLYAELLSSAGQHGLAAAQYERTAYTYGQHDKAAEAGYAALLAYAKHESVLQGAGQSVERSTWHRAGIDSALRFCEQFPTHKEALAVRTRAAQQLYALDEYAAAIAAAQPLADTAGVPPQLQVSAWTVIAHAEFDQGDYPRAELAYRQVLTRTPDRDPKRVKLEEKFAASIYKQGEYERAAGNLAGAADHFLRIARIVPDSGINAIARYDAAAAYIALEQWPAAIRILEAWRQDYPKHKLQDDVSRKLAVLYRENHQPGEAAREFARLADHEQDPRLRREATLATATLYQQAGQDTYAIDAYTRFIARYPQPVEAAMEARYQLVQLCGRLARPERQRYWQEQLVSADRDAGTQRTARTRYLAAHAQLALVAADNAAYAQVPLKEPLKTNLARKKGYMQAAIKGYTRAAAYEVAEVTTESTFRIGELYADFSRALVQSERPHNLSGEALEQYNAMLDEQAYPFEEKAITVHETNARRIGAGLYDAWVRKSMARLAGLSPARYAKQEQGEKFVDAIQ